MEFGIWKLECIHEFEVSDAFPDSVANSKFQIPNSKLPSAAMKLPRFSDLARFRVHDILLVSSLYDSFILAEDGELHGSSSRSSST